MVCSADADPAVTFVVWTWSCSNAPWSCELLQGWFLCLLVEEDRFTLVCDEDGSSCSLDRRIAREMEEGS